MKQLSLTIISFLLLTTTSIAQKKENAKYASNLEGHSYKVYYDNLKFGKNAHSTTILNLWHAYDRNMWEGVDNLIADTVYASFPDGSETRGKQNFLTGAKTYRDGFSSVVSEVSAVTTVKSPADPNHEVTLIWGLETATKKDGTVQKMQLHEVWFFNKDGKIARFHQFAAPVLDKTNK